LESSNPMYVNPLVGKALVRAGKLFDRLGTSVDGHVNRKRRRPARRWVRDKG
jgi:hypothetical protein